MTTEELEKEIRDEFEKMQSKLNDLEKEINDLANTVIENAQVANGIKGEM